MERRYAKLNKKLKRRYQKIVEDPHTISREGTEDENEKLYQRIRELEKNKMNKLAEGQKIVSYQIFSSIDTKLQHIIVQLK